MLCRTAHLAGTLGLNIRIVEETEVKLHGQHIGHSAVDVGHCYKSLVERLLKVVAESSTAEIHVETCLQSKHSRLLVVGSSAHAGNAVDRQQVAVDKALEAPLATQHVGEQVAV